MPRDAFAQGAAVLAARYRLIHDDALFTATGFLAGDDARRAAELTRALTAPEFRAVFAGRGGYGLTRLLPALDLAPLRERPRLFAGFSDATALHAALWRHGLVSVHGPVVTQLGRLDAADDAALFSLLESPDPPPPWTGLIPIAPGAATGPLVGGNLEVLTRLLGTPFFPPLDGAILLLEEVAERPYRLDRLLTHLHLAGVFARACAVVVGDLTECEGPPHHPTPGDVVRERLGRLPIPVVAGAPFGHGDRHRPFAHGALARLDATAGTLTFLEGAVA